MALLGADHRRLLLRLAHEEEPFGLSRVLKDRHGLLGAIILPFALPERDHRDLVRVHKRFRLSSERSSDRLEQPRRRTRRAALVLQIPGDPAGDCSLGM
ncbi:MAG: hypothetical protein ACT4P7_15070 [Gemmatimonadaceae bacterium]